MSWNEICYQLRVMDPSIGGIALRMACAMLVGLVIGTEREITNRPAGMRTHTLVALGACVISITGQILFSQYHALGATPDPGRLSAQVVTGVGFLGAGTILREGATVRGLTTAASLWAVACLGIAAGYGYYLVAIIGMLFIFVTLTVFERIQHRILSVHNAHECYDLQTRDLTAALRCINSEAGRMRIEIHDLQAEVQEDGYRISFRADFSGKTKERKQTFFNSIATAEGTVSVRHTAQSEHSAR